MPVFNRPCDKCELCSYATHTCLQGVGNKRAKVVIVGDNPNWTEDESGIYGAGNSFKLLNDLCHAGEIDSFYYVPAVRCRKPEKGKISASVLKACKEWLIPELEEINPDFVITLGATALKAVTNKAKITEVHGQVIQKDGYVVLPTFHPAMSLRDPRFWESIHTDFRRFGKLIRGIQPPTYKLNMTWVKTKEQAEAMLRKLKRSRVVAYDLETNGLQPRLHTSEIGQTAIAIPSCEFVVEHKCFSKSYLRVLHREILNVLTGKVVVGHNAKFDNLWLHYQMGVRLPLTFDTMLAAHLLDENSPIGLKALARRILDAQDWEVSTRVKKGVNLTPGEEYQRAEYAAWDVFFTIRLYSHFRERLERDESLHRLFHQLVIPTARAYEQVEINGIYVDLERLDAAEKQITKKMRIVMRKLNRVARINWNSSAELNKLLFDTLELTPQGLTESGKPSTAEDNLIKMKGQHPVIEWLLEYRGLFKQMSGFIEGWKKRMIGGKLYPSFKVAGTVTGRPSCSDPNLQQVPRDVLIRSNIGAPKGWRFFEVDYSQVELRIAAAVSGEPNMLRIFRDGGDIHEATYLEVFGITPEQATQHITDPIAKKAQLKEERKKAKAINFGFIYGMGWKKFQEYASSKFGLSVNEKEARSVRKRFFQVYPGLVEWHNRQRRIVAAMKQVRTHTGRIRHLPQIDSPDRSLSSEAERNSINAPVQGFGAELILMSMVEVSEYFSTDDLQIGGTIHDAMVGIVREEIALPAMARVKKIMESPRIMREFGIELPLPLIADVSLGNWGVAEEYSADQLPEPYVNEKESSLLYGSA